MNDQLETAVNLAWTAGNSNTRFGIAAKYQIDPDASFSVSSVTSCNSNSSSGIVTQLLLGIRVNLFPLHKEFMVVQILKLTFLSFFFSFSDIYRK